MSEVDNKEPLWLRTYSNVLGKIESGLGVVSGVIVVTLMLVTSANVSGRYLFSKPVIGAIEISIIIFIMSIMLVQPWVQANKAHLGLEFVLERLSPRRADILRLVALIIEFVVIFLLAWQSGKFAMRNWFYAAHGVQDYYYWPALLSVSVAFSIVCFRIPHQIYQQVLVLKRPKSQEKVQ